MPEEPGVEELADGREGRGLSRGQLGSSAFAESVRLHPYYAQRVLSQVRPLADLAADVGASAPPVTSAHPVLSSRELEVLRLLA